MVGQKLLDCRLDQGLHRHAAQHGGELGLAVFRSGIAGAQLDLASALRAVAGFWRYSSGCDYCVWLVAGADAEEPDETGRCPRRRFLLPISALEIVDDWRVLGLAGTGSKSLRGEDVFVPEWRSLTDREFLGNTGPGRSLHDHCHLYRLSRYAHPGPLSLAIAGVGIAQHAVDYCTAHVDRMGVGRTSAVEREAIRHDMAEATTEVDAARLLIRRTVGEIDCLVKGALGPVPPAGRAGRARPSFRNPLCPARGAPALPARCTAPASRTTRLGAIAGRAGATEV
jgi:alkylation response protein AidB-like acyl-CoA dehydrogenase